MNVLGHLLFLQYLAVQELSAERIMELVKQRDRFRAAQLAQYSVIREYVVVNERWNKRARMEVKLVFRSPDQKEFEVLSEEGSGFIRGRVIKRLLKTEQEGMRLESSRNSAIDSNNYEFSLLGQDAIDGRTCYVLDAKPRRKDQLLFVGRVYVDKQDFAIARIEGSPAKKPSFWTTDIDFVRQYRKFGEFWLPVADESITKVRIFGPTHLTVRYGDYTIGSQKGDSQWLP